MDIVVTTPIALMGLAALEAAEIKAAGGGFYFRRLQTKPSKLNKGDRVWYVEDGYLRGFAIVKDIICNGAWGPMRCDTSGREWPPGNYIIMDAKSWTWIEPQPMKGFQGWRYAKCGVYRVVGSWRDPKPPDDYKLDQLHAGSYVMTNPALPYINFEGVR